MMRRSKYRATPTVVGGIRFASKAEAAYYQALVLKVMAGDVRWFLRQVPVDLPGNITYRADFLVCDSSGEIELIDVKGVSTQAFNLKRKLMKAHCPIPLRVIRAVYRGGHITCWGEG